MIGQISNSEFLSLYERAHGFGKGFNPVERTAWISYGRSTINYWMQHSDDSWSNYKTKTIDRSYVF